MTTRSSRLAKSLLAAVVAGSLLATTPAQATGHTAGGSPAATDRPTPGTSTHRITLVTGDVAELTTSANGQVSARLTTDEPYYFGNFDGDLTLVPANAYPLLTEGRLDRRLFNLTDLVAQGYDDARSDRLPLLLTAPATLRSAPPAQQAATVRRTLPSVGSTAVSVQKADAKTFWDNVSGPTTFKAGTQVGKIWLDGRTHATLDRSTKQIGAPTAWRNGYDGNGVKVAVLDTGYDTKHPDLAKQVVASESFIPDQAVQDLHGHGTHTASIVAGLGTASDGRRKGVAPGADLLVGKVLDNSGSGYDSEAIAGMEWAVQQGAKVISMSLGGVPTDGSDPMSQAVDRLSKESGALFVIAAGNAGLEESVASPGAASEALTVGAVDRDDKLAYFSSRGPRLGDGALKPEVTAPGVEIAAARAYGTEAGHVLGEYYTAMSGTSMATPHVAGAAAILSQRHPDWTGPQLKAALAATAVPSAAARADQQGLGRIDIPKALDPKILPDTANLYFGDVSWTGAAPKPVTRQVAYRNTTSRPVTLDLTVDARSPANIRAAITVSPARMTIPAGGTASATVTLDLLGTKPAKYSGALTARSSGTSYRIGIGFAAGGRMHEVTVKGIGRDGQPATTRTGASGVQLWNQDTGDVRAIAFDQTGTRVLEVPTGRYSVMAYAMGGDEADWTNSVTLMGDPDEWIDRDRAFTFDARGANKVTVKTPLRTDAQSIGIAWHRKVGNRDAVSGWGYDERVADGVYVQDFGKVANGTFQVVQRWDLAQPKLTVDVSGSGESFQLPTPREASFRTVFVGHENLPVVDGRDGTPEQLAGAKDKIALVRYVSFDDVEAQVKAAKDAGARALFMYNEQPGFWSTGSEQGIPFYLLRADQGKQLLALLAKGPVTFQLDGLLDSTYRYDLAVGPSTVKGPLTYDVGTMRPAAVTTDYLRNDAWFLHRDARIAYLPGISTGLSARRLVTGPVTRTDYLATDLKGVTWEELTAAGEWNESGFEYSTARGYRPNEKVTRRWWEPLMRPAIPDNPVGTEADGLPVARFENAIRIAIPQYVSGDGDTYGWGDRGDVTNLELSSNGVKLGSKNWSVAQFPVPATAAWYDLKLDQQRGPNSWAATSTATHTEWRFHSRPSRGRTVLPLVQVDYQVADGRLQLKPGYQPGARGPGLFRTTADISYDDGTTWQRLPLRPHGPGGTVGALIPGAPDGAQYANLRVTATDLAGNRISQTIERAWAVR
ncbi:peptidase S8/S53 subtilisin kexin sedolisin [Kribbella turkmenica]|uniref:Peptidase S8/S53 subtilisin kexin sedolisin n=1 Tax=Kribbella turkmenica TaxID=2530375 RepID=A0A4R4WCB8_9ACTN|nr:S8 family serine peptidase [Kribbella turkmenica]TDD16469.1 peptidase S8/S53 subtilisin kexin sedolisin [Kribbella turkmenica]